MTVLARVGEYPRVTQGAGKVAPSGVDVLDMKVEFLGVVGRRRA